MANACGSQVLRALRAWFIAFALLSAIYILAVLLLSFSSALYQPLIRVRVLLFFFDRNLA